MGTASINHMRMVSYENKVCMTLIPTNMTKRVHSSIQVQKVEKNITRQCQVAMAEWLVRQTEKNRNSTKQHRQRISK